MAWKCGLWAKVLSDVGYLRLWSIGTAHRNILEQGLSTPTDLRLVFLIGCFQYPSEDNLRGWQRGQSGNLASKAQPTKALEVQWSMTTTHACRKNDTLVLLTKEERKLRLFSAFKSRKDCLYMILFSWSGNFFFCFSLLLPNLAVCECKHFYHRDLGWYLTVIHTKVMRPLVLEEINHSRFGLPGCRSHCICVCCNESPPPKASGQEAALEVFYSAAYWTSLG